MWKGRDIIVDGHNRYKICQELKKEPTIVEIYFKSTNAAILYALEHQENRRNQQLAAEYPEIFEEK
jgi:ParB-like chromosome segregation protein Spo0J